MTRRGAWHVYRSREHVLCRTGGCMRHETCNANGHGMACNGRIPTSAVSQDTMGRIPPRRQQPRASVKILNVSFSNKFGLYRRQNLAQTPNGDCTGGGGSGSCCRTPNGGFRHQIFQNKWHSASPRIAPSRARPNFALWCLWGGRGGGCSGRAGTSPGPAVTGPPRLVRSPAWCAL